MADLSHAIRAFQTGGLSPHEFLAQIDRVLATDRTDYARLLEILGEEHTKLPLPPEVYAEVRRRIEHLAEPDQNVGDDHTRMQLNPALRFPPGEAAAPLPDDRAEGIKGVGDTVNGRFLLEECLGFGGMGTVYKALDLRKLEASDRNPYIAIKVLNLQFRGHPKSLIALQREAKKAQTLAHPNIVTVYDFDRDGPMVYLTMEYLKGKPLSRVLRDANFHGMPYAQALPIITGMANALSYAHQRGFVHCDFKPANVFLTDSGQVKVIDFGIARAFHRPEEEAEATVFDAGSLGGLTPAYASPEMLEHREPDPRDDIYALACISYELLTGTHPFGRLPATQARSAGLRPPRPKTLPSGPWRALRAALSFDRETRTRTVVQFLQGISGERRMATPLAAAMAGLAGVVLATAVLIYYWNASRTAAPEQTVAEPAASAVAEPPAAAEPPAEIAAPAPETPPPVLSLASVTPVLAEVPCSAFTASISGDVLGVRGYVAERYGLAQLNKALWEIPGAATVNTDVQLVGDDKCEVIQSFAPHWARNQEAGRSSAITMRDGRTELTEGDSLVMDLKTPGYQSYVHVDYYSLDGNVVHLVPSRRIRAHQAPPNYAATIGTLSGWTIAKPFGTELIVLLVTPVPLFDSLRPDAEGRSGYLPAVEQRLRQIAAEHGPERITADFVQITTRPRNP